jgi:hypothetical protein
MLGLRVPPVGEWTVKILTALSFLKIYGVNWVIDESLLLLYRLLSIE